MTEISKVWISDGAVHILTVDGREASERVADYPRLRFATDQQLHNYEVDDFGIHWPELNEDLCFEAFFRKKMPNSLYLLLMAHPEINAASLARRIGLSQMEMAKAITSSHEPGKELMDEVVSAMRAIGKELIGVRGECE